MKFGSRILLWLVAVTVLIPTLHWYGVAMLAVGVGLLDHLDDWVRGNLERKGP